MERSIEIVTAAENICEVEYFFNSLLKEFNFPRKIFCRIYLAVNEAVTNAIVHGNKNSAEKKIKVQFIENPENYSFWVIDEGDGFNFNQIPSPVEGENVKKESGRGIFIMKQYSDQLFFENDGRAVNLIFNK